MARRATVLGFVFFALIAAAFVLTYIPKARLNANMITSQNNLRGLGQFGAYHVKPDPKRDPTKLPTTIPPGTLVVPDKPGVPPENRLSWVVTLLPLMDQQKNPVVDLLPRIDDQQPWSFEPNQQAGLTRLPGLLCPENTPAVPAGAPGITCYVGIGGLGPDAANLPLGSPRSGAFRYDGPTPFDRITDGLSQTLLFAETRNDVGPWLRGGVGTVRGLNDAPNAPPLVGVQLGGYFPVGVNVAMCDGSVRTFTSQTSPQVLFGLATIAGKGTDPLPGE